MKVCVLSSGSKGNSTLVITDKVKILIDLGTTTSYVEAALNNLNVDVKEISHILITHSHADHIKGLKVFIKRYNPVILVTEDMKNVLEKELGNFRYEYYEDKKAIIGDLTVNVIKTSHDAEESIGFVLTNNNSSMVYITDTGYINQKYFKILSNNNLYVLESNHDIKMLMDGPYPYYLQQRVRGDKGHLSNKQASDYLCKFIGDNTRKIVFAHISEHNNSYEKVIETFNEELSKNDMKFDDVLIAKQNEATEVIEV
ncbi:metal-dependent hydrolases of the beta-lactamase superfamily I [Clostridium sp. CAG:433]|jgi:phosphoribosyl 1,2-cyclic phosphodiesterase|nr:metal-dependent hydrolases of the beta-lactamase superfamily I [Clostridium sp. CAG:433]HCJ31549.1 MBL fold metallo-hydrolase [Bacillota bacterium]